MFIKKFFVVMAVLLSASLFLIGCPTEAEDGKPGEPGQNATPTPPQGSVGSGNVTADDLDEYFNDLDWEVVVLPSSATSVFGVVPEGKKLVVVGQTVVWPGEPLTVEAGGTLEVRENAVLYASYTAGQFGYLVNEGTITGAGALVLPVFAASATKPDTNVVTFDSSTTLEKFVGSYNTAVASATPASSLGSADIKTVFATSGDTLTVSGVGSLDATAIPAGKTLTLTGPGNSLAAGLDLSSPATTGTLIVASGAELSTSGGAIKGTITINEGGTLTLGNAGDSVGDGVTNNGIIAVEASLSGVSTAVTALLRVNGGGTVVFGDENATSISNTLTINTTPVALNQHVVIRNSATLTVTGSATVPFSSALAAVTPSVALQAVSSTPSVPITIDVGGVLALPAAATGIGVAVENNGTISTLAGNAETVIALLALPNVTGGGVIELAENVTLNAEAKLSVQDVKIGAGKTLIAHSIATPFSSTTEKRIINEGTLTLPAAVTSVGVGVINKGTVRTAATEELAAVLDKINKEDAVNTIELTSPITAATPVSIVSAGTVEFSNAAAPVFGVGSSIKAATIEFKDGLKSPATDGTVTLDAAEVIIPANKTILFGGAAGTITLAAGTEVVASTGGTVLLKADGGKAELKGVATTVVTASTGGLAISAGASTFGGPVSFAGTLAVSGGAVIFDGPVAFSDDLTLSGIAATFNGNVSVVKQKAIVLSDTSSSVRLGAGVYLGLPAAAGVPAVYKSVIYNPSEVATEVVVLTAAAANTKLTFGDSSENPPRLITQANSGTGAHGITITGKASLPAGATYTVASEANNVGTLSLGTNAELSLAAGYLVSADEDKANGLTTASPSSKLALIGASGTNGAILAGAGKVIAGGSTIVGGTNGWQAVDSNSSTVPVTISVDKIESDASTTALTAVTGTSQPSITVAAAGTLTIAGNTEIALAGDSSAVGSIVLKYGTTGAKIVFAAAGAKISTSLTSGTTAVTATIAGGITANGGTVGTSLTVTSTAATGNSLKLGSITPTSSSPTFNGAANVITGPTSTADTTINSTLTVTAAA